MWVFMGIFPNPAAARMANPGPKVFRAVSRAVPRDGKTKPGRILPAGAGRAGAPKAFQKTVQNLFITKSRSSSNLKI
jgi:hypothetical protein